MVVASRLELLAAATLLAAAALSPSATQAAPAPPIGTWHVLVHYQRPDGPHPSRWLWEERVWVIERSAQGLIWTEHAIVSFEDESGRFENLGTNRARRLVGAWKPNEQQRRELKTGINVESRGMRSNRLVAVADARWQSEADASLVGRSASGVAYHEVWSIVEERGHLVFEIENRLEASEGSESAGATIYRLDARAPQQWGTYERRGGDRAGRARMVRTRILIAAPDSDSDKENDKQNQKGQADTSRSRSIELVPDHRINSDVPLLVTVLRPHHYYADRTLTIDSTPPGAELDLAYTRRGGQLLYRRGRAPLEVVLPTRLQADEGDRLLVRGYLAGYERTRDSIAVHSATDHLMLDMTPLANQLRGVSHGHLAGRSVLELRSAEPPTVRIGRDDAGYSVVMLRTGLADPIAQRLSELSDPLLDISGRQLGDDLVLRLATRRSDLELRQLRVTDPGGRDFRTRLEVVVARDADRVARLRAAIDSLDQNDLDACAPAFEEALRAGLTDRTLARTLGRDDHAENPTLRASLRRFAAVNNQGTLRTRAGEMLTTESPLEFELAWSRSAEIEGFLAWIEVLAARVEPGDRGSLAFRSLVAPAWAPQRFAELLAAARRERTRCSVQPRGATRSDRE